MADPSTATNEITPEKLTLMKIKAGGFEREFLSEPTTPSHIPPSLDFPPLRSYLPSSGNMHVSSGNMHSSSVARQSSSRRISSSARRSSSFLLSHRNKMSSELTSQAEGKFFALIDLMSTASREASALKESWGRIISEREALSSEREALMLQLDEVTETLERTQSEYHHQGHELVERKRHVEKLLSELSVAFTAVSEQKKKVADRDRGLESARAELSELRTTISHSSSDHDIVRTELETLTLRLRTAEDDRDHARHDAHQHHDELRTLLREHTDLKSKHAELNAKLESSRREALSLTDRIKMWELEKDEYLHEKDRLQEELKRAKLRAEEASRNLVELTERHDRIQRDHTKLKEMVRTMEIDRDDFALTVDNLRRDVKTKAAGWEEADARYDEVNTKYEQFKREVTTTKEKLRDVETDRTELRDSVDRSREEHRLVVIERDQLKEDLTDERRKLADSHRRVSSLEDSLRIAQLTATEVRSEVRTLTERNKVLVREGEDSRAKHGHLSREVEDLRDKLVNFQSEIRTLTEARDRAYGDLSDWKQKYEEVTETITEYHDNSGELEFEIGSLRTQLREAREQKERAIAARYAADRERDEHVAKYEEKCREFERYAEEAASTYHAHGRTSGGKSFSRNVSTTGTTVHHSSKQGQSSHGHGYRHNSAEGVGILSST